MMVLLAWISLKTVASLIHPQLINRGSAPACVIVVHQSNTPWLEIAMPHRFLGAWSEPLMKVGDGCLLAAQVEKGRFLQ